MVRNFSKQLPYQMPPFYYKIFRKFKKNSNSFNVLKTKNMQFLKLQKGTPFEKKITLKGTPYAFEIGILESKGGPL